MGPTAWPSTLRTPVGASLIGLLLGLAECVAGLSASGAALLLGIYPGVLTLLIGGGRCDPDAARKLATTDSSWRTLVHAGSVRLLRPLALLLGLAAGVGLGAALGLGELLRAPLPAALLFAAAFALLIPRVLALRESGRLVALLFVFGGLVGYGVALAEPPPDTPSVLPGLLGTAATATLALGPGVGSERVLVVTGSYAWALHLLASGQSMHLLLLLAIAGAVFVFMGRTLLSLHGRATTAVQGLLLGVFAGSTVQLWPWQLVSAYTLLPSGGQIGLTSRAVGPATFAAHTGLDPSLPSVLGVLLLSVAAIAWSVRRGGTRPPADGRKRKDPPMAEHA